MPAVVMSSSNLNTNSPAPGLVPHHEDEEAWPSLGGPSARTIAPTKKPVKSNSPVPEKDDSTSHNEWEMLPLDADEESEKSAGQEEPQNIKNNSSKTVSFDTVEDDLKEDSTGIEVRADPKLLHHCVSSPDLRRLSAVQEDDDDGDDSYSMVSGVGSVISMASSTTAGLSFRDAMLAAKATTPQKSETTPVEVKTTPRRRTKAKFVVVQPIKRCAKSTGDLQSLIIDEGDESHGGSGGGAGPILGDTDAMDFYHRKAQGAKGRANGLKLRPDEAKRKNIIMHKKDLQRQKQQS